jgi:hypothetical protein
VLVAAGAGIAAWSVGVGSGGNTGSSVGVGSGATPGLHDVITRLMTITANTEPRPLHSRLIASSFERLEIEPKRLISNL